MLAYATIALLAAAACHAQVVENILPDYTPQVGTMSL